MNLNGRLSYTGNVRGSMGASLVANVEANPAGAASEILTKIRVGDTIYKIPSGGGGGGVTSYSLLSDKPKINNHTLDGSMTSADLDLQDKIVFPEDGSKYLDGDGNFTVPANKVFIDTDNVIQARTTIPVDTTINYTASEDCIVIVEYYGSSSSGDVSINGVIISQIYCPQSAQVNTVDSFYLKAGQTISMKTRIYTGGYTVYGLM